MDALLIICGWLGGFLVHLALWNTVRRDRRYNMHGDDGLAAFALFVIASVALFIITMVLSVVFSFATLVALLIGFVCFYAPVLLFFESFGTRKKFRRR